MMSCFEYILLLSVNIISRLVLAHKFIRVCPANSRFAKRNDDNGATIFVTRFFDWCSRNREDAR